MTLCGVKHIWTSTVFEVQINSALAHAKHETVLDGEGGREINRDRVGERERKQGTQ